MAFPNAGSHYSLDQLGDGVYAAIHRDGGAAISNAGLIDLGDSSLIVDTFLTPTAAEHLRADAQRLTGRLPRWVVNTHYHNDHIWGNQVFLPEADLISTVETRRLIQTAGKEEYDDYRAITDDRLRNALAEQAAAETPAQRAASDLWIGYFGGLQRDFPRLRVTLPNMLFKDRLVLQGSSRRVELIAFSGAHTGSDTVVYLPDDGIVFMSDLLFTGFHPYLGDGNPELWLNVLQSILDGSAGIQNARCFLPGHGPAGTAEDLRQLADYIRQIQLVARRLVDEGKGKAGTDSAAIPDAFSNWTMPRFFYANLSFLVDKYRETDHASRGLELKKESNSFRP